MGWFWGSSDSDDGKKGQDPLRDLDPSLRDFLKKESPIKYNDSNPPAAPPAKRIPAPEPTSVPSPAEEESKVPKESLYKDGRYAHLWKTYESQSSVENANKSDQEKIQDVIEGYKYRKAEIGRAALENCALEQFDVNDCFRNPKDWTARVTMCRDENRKLERCYTMQAKFLKALGYLSTFDRPADVDEQIQMHADTLYHRMLDQEAAIEKAKAEGLPIPTFSPILSKPKKLDSTTDKIPFDAPKPENSLKPSDLSEKVQLGLKKRLEDLPERERQLEERAIEAELQAGEQVARNLGSIYERQAEERRRRKEEGKETIGDKFASIFNMR